MATTLSVVGLGKLGLCLASCYAYRGFKVIGVDINPSVVDAVNSRKAPWYEPRLQEVMTDNLTATTKHNLAIEQSDTTIILTATPSNPDGSFSNRYIEEALIALSKELSRSNKEYHLFIISSTVMPGSIQNSFIPLIEKHSGRILNKGFGIGYDPDFVALGNVIKGFLQPEIVIIGESCSEVGDRIEVLHSKLNENIPVRTRMTLPSAEIAKVCLNAYVTTKISFANTIANLCEKTPGTNPDDITRAIGADRRISPYYFQGGLAYGGTCFPRDVTAFRALCHKNGLPYAEDLINAVDDINDYQNENLIQKVVTLALKEDKTPIVGILGMAFTNNTPVVVESPAMKLLADLLRHGISVCVYDPNAMNNVRTLYENGVTYCQNANDCIEHSDLVVVALRLNELKEAVENFVYDTPKAIIDCWRFIDPSKIRGARYFPLGIA